jgi:sortase A
MDATSHPWPQRGSGAPQLEHDERAEAAPRRALGAVGFLLDAVRRRRSGRITLWSLVIGLTLGGVWLIAYPFITNFWADRIQGGLEEDFSALEAQADPNATGYAQLPGEGQALTRLRIPKLGISVIVVEGVSGNALRAGAGHFPDTELPGGLGNVAIAGHRTGYGEPFRHLERLTAGDQIILDTPFATFVYKVMSEAERGGHNPWIVEPTDITVKGQTPEAVVTLVTCDPPGTSKRRLVVRGKLVRELDG